MTADKLAGSTTTNYVYDQTRYQVLAEYEDSGGGFGLARHFVYGAGIDEPVVMHQNDTYYYYHRDGLGSVVNLTDFSGATVKTYYYEVYGDFSASGAFSGNPYTFTGRRYDSESELFYYRARYYSLSLGRFIQVDPIGYGTGPNLYTYIFNATPNLVDPLGLLPCEDMLYCDEEEEEEGEWDAWDFVDHYYDGEGEPVDLGDEDVGLLDIVKDAADDCQTAIETILEVAIHDLVAPQLQCPGASEATANESMKCEFDATDDIFVLGDTTLEADWTCTITPECSSCTFTYSCNIDYSINDEFTDPLDIHETFPWLPWSGDLPAADPFALTAEWENSISGEGVIE